MVIERERNRILARCLMRVFSCCLAGIRHWSLLLLWVPAWSSFHSLELTASIGIALASNQDPDSGCGARAMHLPRLDYDFSLFPSTTSATFFPAQTSFISVLFVISFAFFSFFQIYPKFFNQFSSNIVENKLIRNRIFSCSRWENQK